MVNEGNFAKKGIEFEPVFEGWPSMEDQEVMAHVELAPVKLHLKRLAALNGTPLEPTLGHPELHFSTDRVALTEEDIRARHELIAPWMEQAGLEVTHHPLAVIGRMAGKNSDLPPLCVLSHVDTVPKGDMYDGTLGVTAGIEVAESFRDQGVQPDRDLIFIAVTGEESSGFNFPLVGSRSLFHGLTDEELEARSTRDNRTLKQTLIDNGEDLAIVQEPFFGEGHSFPLPSAVVELHVEQASRLEAAGVEIGVIEAIAAPERYKVRIGDNNLDPDSTDYKHKSYFELGVAGKADHSGTTPIAASARADGLLATAEFLQDLISSGELPEGTLHIGDIEVEDGSINKIPGVTKTQIRVASDDEAVFESVCKTFRSAVVEANALSNRLNTNAFEDNPLSIKQLNEDGIGRFFKSESMQRRQQAAFNSIITVNRAAIELADRGVVGTVGTFKCQEGGQIELAVDFRGTNLEARREAVSELRNLSQTYGSYDGTKIALGEMLAGSGEPVVMNPELRTLADKAIRACGISTLSMDCLAGHDVQNAARAGIKSLIILCQSNNEGRAHTPETYTADEHLLSGIRAYAAVITLLSRE